MISSLILLTATLFASPVFISDVKASREAGHLRVEVRGDGGIDPDAARTVIDDGRLVIYLGGARVRADNRSWELKDGAGEIRAHRHKTETELVVPLTDNGNRLVRVPSVLLGRVAVAMTLMTLPK